MINETASSTDDRPALRSSARHSSHEHNAARDELRQLVMTVLMIERESTPSGDQPNAAALTLGVDAGLVISFEGHLLFDSELAYDKLDHVLAPLNYLPLFREANGKHVIHILAGRAQPDPRPAALHVGLFVATVISVLLLGIQIAIGEIGVTDGALASYVAANWLTEIWRGLPHALSILLILGAREAGHYWMARRHKVAISLPYFVPAALISWFGTYGAFMQLREPPRNRKALLDIGAAGALFGLLATIPIVLIGLSTSPVGPVSPGGILEGNSLLYALSKTLVFGRFLPDANGIDVTINQLATAGWVGLFLTGLNLLPIGQLDGGHILYALIGERARALYLPIMAAMVILTLMFPDTWLLVLVILFLFGRTYAAPLDMITKLDTRRRVIGLLCVIVFFVTVVPIPVTIVTDSAGGAQSQGALLPLALVDFIRVFGAR